MSTRNNKKEREGLVTEKGSNPFSTNQWDMLDELHSSLKRKAQLGGVSVPSVFSKGLTNPVLQNTYNYNHKLNRLDALKDSQVSDAKVHYRKDNGIKLTQGRYNTGVLPKNMLDEFVKISKEEGVDVYDLLAVAGRESMFGNRDKEFSLDKIGKQRVISGWDLDNKYSPKSIPAFLADRKVPFVTVDKQPLGYKYYVNDQDAYDNYLKANPDVLDKYEAYSRTIPKPDYGEYNSYRELARMIKNHQMNTYNPKDPDYENKLANEKALLLKEKGISDYLKSLNLKEQGGEILSQYQWAGTTKDTMFDKLKSVGAIDDLSEYGVISNDVISNQKTPLYGSFPQTHPWASSLYTPEQVAENNKRVQQNYLPNTNATTQKDKNNDTFTIRHHHTFDSLDNNAWNRSLIGINSLTDPRSLIHALPNRGLFGAVKGVAGAASALSGSILGYEKAFSKPKDFTYDAHTGERLGIYDVNKKQQGGQQMFSLLEKFKPKAQSGIEFNPSANIEADRNRNLTNEEMSDLNQGRTSPESTMNFDRIGKGTEVAGDYSQWLNENAKNPKDRQHVLSRGDSRGMQAANNAITGLGIVNNVLDANQQYKQYKEMLRRTGNTDNRFSVNNPNNPFGGYTLNTGPASNFALSVNTPSQDFGTSMNFAAFGGAFTSSQFGGITNPSMLKYKEGDTVELSFEDLQRFKEMGGEFEIL